MNTITERPTVANLRVAAEALVEVPDHLPEPQSITIYPHLRPSITWHVTDAAVFEAIRAWLAFMADDGYLSDHQPTESIASRIVSTVGLGSSWSVALIRQQATA